MRHYFSKLLSRHGALIFAAAAVLVLYLVMFALGIGCPLKYLSGISCAGCGMTRACMSALRLELSQAFAYHPLWIGLPVVFPLLIFFKIKKMNRAFYALAFSAAAVMLAVYFYRLLFTDSPVVVFAPEQGAIYKLFKRISELFTH